MPAKIRPRAVPATLVASAVIVVLVWAAVLASSGAEAASDVGCGDTITTDTTLDHNLVNCPNNGLVIGADNVTLDLNYHTIDGDGTPAAGCDPQKDFCDTGIVNFGHGGVTVMHGALREFDSGVSLFGPLRHNRLLDISSRNRVVGISLFRASRTQIQNSSGNHSFGPDAFAGLGVFNSDHVRVLHNSFRHNAGDHGMVMADTTDSVIKGNRFFAQWRRGTTHRDWQPQRDQAKPRLQRPRGHPDREGARQPGRRQCRQPRSAGGHPPRNPASVHRRRCPQHSAQESSQGQPRRRLPGQ